MEIKVIGTGCEKCGKLYENTLEAVKAAVWRPTSSGWRIFWTSSVWGS